MKNTIYACLAVLLIFCGCSSKSDNINSLVEYIPFQSCEDGRWGLISTDGEVLLQAFHHVYKFYPAASSENIFIWSE